MERVKGDEVVHFTLDALESTTLIVFEVVRVDVTVQKGQKNVHFRIFATKNTANLANF